MERSGVLGAVLTLGKQTSQSLSVSKQQCGSATRVDPHLSRDGGSLGVSTSNLSLLVEVKIRCHSNASKMSSSGHNALLTGLFHQHLLDFQPFCFALFFFFFYLGQAGFQLSILLHQFHLCSNDGHVVPCQANAFCGEVGGSRQGFSV